MSSGFHAVRVQYEKGTEKPFSRQSRVALSRSFFSWTPRQTVIDTYEFRADVADARLVDGQNICWSEDSSKADVFAAKTSCPIVVHEASSDNEVAIVQNKETGVKRAMVVGRRGGQDFILPVAVHIVK